VRCNYGVWDSLRWSSSCFMKFVSFLSLKTLEVFALSDLGYSIYRSYSVSSWLSLNDKLVFEDGGVLTLESMISMPVCLFFFILDDAGSGNS
jgi:hypothetical protein